VSRSLLDIYDSPRLRAESGHVVYNLPRRTAQDSRATGSGPTSACHGPRVLYVGNAPSKGYPVLPRRRMVKAHAEAASVVGEVALIPGARIFNSWEASACRSEQLYASHVWCTRRLAPFSRVPLTAPVPAVVAPIGGTPER